MFCLDISHVCTVTQKISHNLLQLENDDHEKDSSILKIVTGNLSVNSVFRFLCKLWFTEIGIRQLMGKGYVHNQSFPLSSMGKNETKNVYENAKHPLCPLSRWGLLMKSLEGQTWSVCTARALLPPIQTNWRDKNCTVHCCNVYRPLFIYNTVYLCNNSLHLPITHNHVWSYLMAVPFLLYTVVLYSIMACLDNNLTQLFRMEESTWQMQGVT